MLTLTTQLTGLNRMNSVSRLAKYSCIFLWTRGTICLIFLTVSATHPLVVFVSAQGCVDSLADLSPLIVRKVVTLLFKFMMELKMLELVSAINCSQINFSLLSTSFLESFKCSLKITINTPYHKHENTT